MVALGQAVQMRALARFGRLRPSADPGRVINEFAADEVAPALRLTRTAAVNRLALAATLTTRLSGALAALTSGEIDLTKVRSLANHTDPLSDEKAQAVQDAVLPRAGRQAASQTGAAIRRAVIRIDPEGAAQRHQAHRRNRGVQVSPELEGMANLIAYLPAEQAAAIYHKVDHLARSASTPCHDRTAAERRAHVFTDLLLRTTHSRNTSGTGSHAHIGARTRAGTRAPAAMCPHASQADAGTHVGHSVNGSASGA